MIQESDLEKMKRETIRFFELHWNKEAHRKTYPVWKAWHFHKTIPNHDKRGCYAIFEGEQLEYIGIASGRSTKRYHGHGLGDRLKVYYRVDKAKNEELGIRKVEERYYKSVWEGVTEIWTIGLLEDVGYLAAALEIYLIPRLGPPRNKVMLG